MALSSFRTMAKQGKPAFGFWMTLPGIHHARHAAHSAPGYSWICVDCEHGLIPLQGSGGSLDSITGILSSHPSSPQPPVPIVRIPAPGSAKESVLWQVKVALDAGAKGVMVPMVGSKEEAEGVVRAARFPTHGGIRGFGSPITHELWGTTASNYLNEATKDVIVMVQIESPAGLENVEEIASVPGIDVLFIGPFDLSLSLGFPPPSPDVHPSVEASISRILKAAKSAGKLAAIYTVSGEQGRKRAEQGFDLVSVANDAAAISSALAKDLEAATGSSKASDRLY